MAGNKSAQRISGSGRRFFPGLLVPMLLVFVSSCSSGSFKNPTDYNEHIRSKLDNLTDSLSSLEERFSELSSVQVEKWCGVLADSIENTIASLEKLEDYKGYSDYRLGALEMARMYLDVVNKDLKEIGKLLARLEGITGAEEEKELYKALREKIVEADEKVSRAFKKGFEAQREFGKKFNLRVIPYNEI